MRIVRFTDTGIEPIEAPDWSTLLAQPDGVLWIDMVGPQDAELQLLREVFKFHPLAIEDTTNQRQRPKIEEYRDHLFIIFNPVEDFKGSLTFRELDVFVRPSYIVTIHSYKYEPIIEHVMHRCESHLDSEQTISIGFLLYAIADTITNRYFFILDKIGDEIESLSERIIENAQRPDLNRIFLLKRALSEMWRVVGQQRDMFNVLTRQGSRYISEEIARYYMRDIYDHLLRISDTVSTFRDTLSSVIDLYMSSVSNKLNLVVRRLTVVTIGIGILTVISGFYGMNFLKTWPPFEAEWGVPFVMTLMLITLVGIVLVIWRIEKS